MSLEDDREFDKQCEASNMRQERINALLVDRLKDPAEVQAAIECVIDDIAKVYAENDDSAIIGIEINKLITQSMYELIDSEVPPSYRGDE